MTRIERVIYLLNARCSSDEIAPYTGFSPQDIEGIALQLGYWRSSYRYDR